MSVGPSNIHTKNATHIYKIVRSQICHEVKIFFNFDLVYGSRGFRPSNSIRFCESATSFSLRYQGLEISGTSGSTKKPLNAIGSEIIPSIKKSLLC